MSTVKPSMRLKDDSEENTDNWILHSKKEHKEIFSELDTLLKSLDRFFYVENLPIPKDTLRDRNFSGELNIVRDVIFRVLGILEVIMPENKKNAYWFQKFAESKFLTDYSRDMFKEKLYKQDTPEKGIYILYDLFINLKGIVTDLLQTDKISYLSYTNIGQLICKEIRNNNFLDPFRKEIVPEFDIIENHEISEIVRSIKDKEIRKSASLLYLHFFRLLRYLRHVDIASHQSIALHSSLLILIMLKSETGMMHSYLKNLSEEIKDEQLKSLLQTMSYQFSMDTKRVYMQELKDVMVKNTPRFLRGKIENSHGILKNLLEQSIVRLTQFFKPEINGNDIFESFTERRAQSVKLREDLFVLHRFLTLAEDTAGLQAEEKNVFEATKNFMQYFETFTFKLLRYEDYDEFVSFFSDIFSLKKSEINKILEKVHRFKIFLETMIQHVSKRAELHDTPVDISRAEELLKQYL